MCMSCGCGQPNNDHGDQRHITQNDLNNAAQAAGITPDQAAQNIQATQSAMGSFGQPSSNVDVPVPPVQQGAGGVQTPVGSSTPDMGVYNTEAADVAMGSTTKPADRGQTEGGPGTSR